MSYICSKIAIIVPRRTVPLTAVGVACILGSFATPAAAQSTAQLSAQSSTAGMENANALRERGVALVYAANIENQVTRDGLKLLEASAAAGNRDALIALGDVYLYATIVAQNWPKALDYFEAAAQAGDGTGLYHYGTMLMWDERDARTAEAILVRAGEMGVPQAWTTLAEGAMYGYLGGGHASRAKYSAYATRAGKEGEQKVAVLEAVRHMWGISVRASGPETLGILKDAANDGNGLAAAFLIKLVRSGNRWNVRRDSAQARAYLAAYRPILTDAAAWQLAVSIDAATARSPSELANVADLVFSQPDFVTQEFGADLMIANPNAAFFVLQRRLNEEGYDAGVADGFVGKRTLRAMNQACRTIAPLASCDDSVMRPDVISTLIAKL